MSNSNTINKEINWEEVVKKEYRGIENADFGEVQEIVLYYILTEKGLLSKEKCYLSTELVEGYEGNKLRFNISEVESNEKFNRGAPPSAEEYELFKKKKLVPLPMQINNTTTKLFQIP